MGFNTIGIYYVHWEQHDFLWRSIAAQADFVDYIFVFDSSLEKKEIKIFDHHKHKVEIEHGHQFGSGFNDQYGLGHFEQIEARNYAMDKVFERCDFMYPCDADEFLSPQAFMWARSAKNTVLHIPELQWRTRTDYMLSPHIHVRGGDKLSGIRHTYNTNTPWLDREGFHRSRHVVFKWNQGSAKIHSVKVPWHNHLHYLGHAVNPEKGNFQKIVPGDPNFLFNGQFPYVYDDFIKERKKDPKYGMRGAVK